MSTGTLDPIVDEKKVVLHPFGIEIDHPRNSDVIIQCIPGLRMRSAIEGNKGAIDHKTKEKVIPKDQIIALGSFPATPGMQLHVNPLELTYMVFDPLHKNVELCLRVKKFLEANTGYRIDATITGQPPLNGTLDQHRMKTLCREMLWLLNSHEAKLAGGPEPTLENIGKLPGYFLVNPGSRVQNQQPIYEKDWDDWLTRLTQSGG